MQTFYQTCRRALFLVLFVFSSTHAQVTYFHQDFAKTTSLVNPLPDTGQFSHMILTAPQLSYHKFHKGYAEFVRSQQDSATGGIIRAMRATPFEPNPKSLFISITLSAESVQSSSVNALYFYVGEDFNPVNNSFPGNGLMFSKFVINFKEDSICIKDSETQRVSRWIAKKEKVTLSWILNNAEKNIVYFVPGSNLENTLAPGKYDLWLNNELVSLASEAYPGTSAYSVAKLTNFEMRFRNGLGKIRIYNILIREGESTEQLSGPIIMPNPTTGQVFFIKSQNIDMNTLKLISPHGNQVPIISKSQKKGLTEIRPTGQLTAGLYILHFQDMSRRRTSLKVIVQ
jgi:hypothetical protein